jgi:hypothetical protein
VARAAAGLGVGGEVVARAVVAGGGVGVGSVVATVVGGTLGGGSGGVAWAAVTGGAEATLFLFARISLAMR